jgi:hypothetical protein
MITRIDTVFLVLLSSAGWVSLGCKSAVEVDIQCPRLCLAAPGPTLRGSASLVPAGLDATVPALPTVDGGMLLDGSAAQDAATIPRSMPWEVTLRFNDVVKQLPTEAVSISLDVRLTSVTLSSTTDLSFITDLQVFLSRTQSFPDGGQTSTSDCWNRISTNPIASYQGQAVPVGGAINLVSLVPDINLFDCIKDKPARFLVQMGVEPSMYPTLDVPLVFSTCVGAQTSAESS